MAAEGELVDVVLTERLPVWRVREALASHLPAGWSLVGVHDVWLGGPALPGRVGGADHLVTLVSGSGEAVGGAELVGAAERLLAASSLPRERPKGDRMVHYDLRPLLIGITVVGVGSPVVLRIRTRSHPELGSGRPEEVVAALGDLVGHPLEISSIVRERLLLVDELD
jgi:hypothetical protein